MKVGLHQTSALFAMVMTDGVRQEFPRTIMFADNIRENKNESQEEKD